MNRHKLECILENHQTERAANYMWYAAHYGKAPVIPAQMYEGLEKDTAEVLALDVLDKCDEMWVFGDVKTDRMMVEYKYACECDMPIVHIDTSGGLKRTRRATNASAVRRDAIRLVPNMPNFKSWRKRSAHLSVLNASKTISLIHRYVQRVKAHMGGVNEIYNLW